MPGSPRWRGTADWDWPRCWQPARELCDGFPVFPRLARDLANAAPRLAEWPSSARVFLPHGRPPETGEVLVQRDLGNLFDRLIAVERNAAPQGRAAAIMAARDEFYTGAISREIAAHSHRTGGALDAEDLATFRVVVGPSVSSTYRGMEVHACGPWSQGPLLPMILNLLDGVDLRRMGAGSSEYFHHVVEAIKLACADREAFFGDPELVDVPLEGLLHPGYAEERRRLLNPGRREPRDAGVGRPVAVGGARRPDRQRPPTRAAGPASPTLRMSARWTRTATRSPRPRLIPG